jgi:hypothetical protein
MREIPVFIFFPLYCRGGNRFAYYKNDYDREEETGPEGEGGICCACAV